MTTINTPLKSALPYIMHTEELTYIDIGTIRRLFVIAVDDAAKMVGNEYLPPNYGVDRITEYLDLWKKMFPHQKISDNFPKYPEFWDV